MQSKAATVSAYLAELPPDRRAAIKAVRRVIRDSVDNDIEEGMYYGMITYYVPHSIFPAGYHCDPRIPLPYVALASQKQYMTLYVMTEYGEGGDDPWLRNEWAKAGKKLDMGKCCIRFKKLEDVPLKVVGEAIRRVPTAAYIARYVHMLESMGRRPAASRGRPGKPAKPAPGKKPSAAAGKTKGAGGTKATRRAKATRTAKTRTGPAAKAKGASNSARVLARRKSTAARAGHTNAAASRGGNRLDPPGRSVQKQAPRLACGIQDL